MSLEQSVCSVCDKPTTLKCGHCKVKKYCSAACQREGWHAGHNKECAKLKEATLSRSNSKSGCGQDEVAPVPQRVLYPYEKFYHIFNGHHHICARPPVGMQNCGNSCYANALLQCLMFTRPLAAYFHLGQHAKTCAKPSSSHWCLLCELEQFFREALAMDPQETISARAIMRHIRKISKRMSFGRQEDAQEFFSELLDVMDNIMLAEVGGSSRHDPRTRETTLLHHMFGGYVRQQTSCSNCGHISRRFDPILQLLLEIPQGVYSVESALDVHFSDEWLDGDNSFSCEGCKDKVRACISRRLEVAPNILVISLKRYNLGRFGKINRQVRYGERLDLSEWMHPCAMDRDPVTYSLYGVVVHLDQMNSTTFGHYISYVCSEDQRWWCCDDTYIQQVPSSRALAQNAYMLFYIRDSPKAAPDPRYRPQPSLDRQDQRGLTPGPKTPQISDEVFSPGVHPQPSPSPSSTSRSSLLRKESLSRVVTAPAALNRLKEGVESSSQEELGSSGASTSSSSSPHGVAPEDHGLQEDGDVSKNDQEDKADDGPDSSCTSVCSETLEVPLTKVCCSADGKKVVVRVFLKGVKSAGEIHMKVDACALSVLVLGQYRLQDFPMPCSVTAIPSSCKFFRKSEVLRVEMDVGLTPDADPGLPPLFSTDHSDSDVGWTEGSNSVSTISSHGEGAGSENLQGPSSGSEVAGDGEGSGESAHTCEDSRSVAISTGNHSHKAKKQKKRKKGPAGKSKKGRFK